MKTRRVYEIECMRNNVTPGQFLAYVRAMAAKKGGNMEYSAAGFAAESWSSNYSDELPDGRTGCEAERLTEKPYEKQTYIKWHDGTIYNQILEFTFDDERRGHGYYYEVQTETAAEDRAENVKESILGIARRAIKKAEKLERQAAGCVDNVNEWTSTFYAAALALTAMKARKEAAELREKARRAVEKLAEYVAAYEPEPSQEEAKYYIPETGETVKESELVSQLVASGDSEAAARESVAGMASELAIIRTDGKEPEPVPSTLAGHDWLTSENIEKLRAALAEALEKYRAEPGAYHVKISGGNIKMGGVPSVSILPVLFCPACCRECDGCGHICYALKLAMIRGSVLRSWAMNTAILLEDWAKYWEEVRAALAGAHFFRFHVSGEIVNRAYFAEMVRAAADFPSCDQLTFTKKFAIVNRHIDTAGALPDNMRLLFSGMAGHEPDNPHNLPETTIIPKNTNPDDVPPSWRICPGSCETCAARGVGCWLARPGDVIAFWQH